jgi:diguanylate cyclase (GGDEF)-like protein/PAS domain S-box-containing protein
MLLPENNDSPSIGKLNEAILCTLLERSPEGLVFSDSSSLICQVNDEFCRMFGYEREEILGKDLDEVVSQDPSLIREGRDLLGELSSKGFISLETERQRKDGTRFPVAITSYPVSADDQYCGFFTIYKDITRQKRYELEIRAREERLREILDNNPEMILRFTPDLVASYANRTYCEYHGISYEDAVGKCFSNHIFPDDIPSVHDKLLTLTPENPSITGEERVLLDNGEIRWQEWTDNGIFDDEGNLVEIQSLGRDTTERKKIEKALSFERESLHALFENAMEGIVFCDNTGTVLKANSVFCAMFGYFREEVLGENVDDLIAKGSEFIEEARAFSAATAAGENIATESVRRRKDGSPIQVSFLGIPVFLSDGKIFGYGIYRDISERKNTEESLRASEAKFRDLIEKMPNGFYTSTPEGYFVDANPAFVRMLGYDSLEELKTVHIPTAIYVHETERVQMHNDNDNTEFVDRLETYRLKRKDGQVIWVEDHARYIKDGNGKVLFNQGICKDITDRKKADEELIRLNRELMVSATTDRVTGLFNRQYFDEIIQREIAKSARYGTPLSMIMIDLDNFKQLNDTRGHLAGDRALSEIARTIRENIRSSDIAARWGGDEFILASPTDSSQALALALKLQELLAGLDHGGYGPVTGSIGVSSFRDGDDENSLTKRADRAMYEVKRRGGNGVNADHQGAI